MANDLSELKIKEVSFCKRGMNQHAKIALFKAKPEHTAIHKYYADAPNSKDFKTLLAENKKREELWEAREELYPLFGALNDSISSIVSDEAITEERRSSMIEQSVNDFLSAVKENLPSAEEELQKFFEDLNAESLGKSKTATKGTDMSDLEKTVAEAVEKATKELTEKLTKSESDLAKATKDMADLKAEEEKKKKKEEMQKNDETVVVAGQSISKAAVGDATFAVFKAQAEQIAKAEERIAKAEEAAEIARLEKRAADEFGHLPGTDAEKARVLKALGAIDGDVNKYVESLFIKANEVNKAAFETVGVKKAAESAASVDAKVAEIVKRDNVSKSVAMEKAAAEAPELFK